MTATSRLGWTTEAFTLIDCCRTTWEPGHNAATAHTCPECGAQAFTRNLYRFTTTEGGGWNATSIDAIERHAIRTEAYRNAK